MTSRFVQSIYFVKLFGNSSQSTNQHGFVQRHSDVPILLVTTSDKISGKSYHTTAGLLPFQLSVVVFVFSSAFEAKTLPENSLILSSEPLICGTIYEGVYGVAQVKQKAVC